MLQYGNCMFRHAEGPKKALFDNVSRLDDRILQDGPKYRETQPNQARTKKREILDLMHIPIVCQPCK